MGGTVLWMDGFPPQGLGFLSNAQVRVTPGSTKLVTTEVTARLAGLSRSCALISPYDRPFAVGQLDLELFPSGHLHGSASLSVRWDGGHFVYTGPINPKDGLDNEPCGVRRSGVLITESRYGHPDYVFPPAEETTERLIDRCRALLEWDETPVLLVSQPLGKPQSLAARLQAQGLPVWAHRRIVDGARRLKELGLPTGRPRRFKPSPDFTGVVLWPTRSRRAPSLQRLSAAHPILVSGEAARKEAVTKAGCEEGFVLSDHADFSSLVEYVERVSPHRVALLPGRAHPLRERLQSKKTSVEILEPTQLSMF